jgi:hypothetical protein
LRFTNYTIPLIQEYIRGGAQGRIPALNITGAGRGMGVYKIN